MTAAVAPRHCVRWIVVGAVLFALAAANYAAFLRHPEGIGHTDAAGHLLPAVRMCQALVAVRPLELLVLAYDQDRWPFVLSVWLMPFLLAGGASWEAGAAGVLGSWLLAGLAIFWTARAWTTSLLPDQEAWSDLAGGIALFWFLSSPVVNVFSTECMLEVPGMALALAAPLLYARARRGPAEARRFSIALTLLFFLKFNFGIYAIAAFVLLEVARHLRDGRSRPWDLARAALRHPLFWVTLAALLAARALARTGGFQFPLLGRSVSVTSPGHPLIVAFWIWVVWLFPRVLRLFARDPGGAAPEPDRPSLALYRAFSVWTLLPAVLWLANPSKIRKIAGWAMRGTGVVNPEPYDPLAYARHVLGGYSLAPAAGALALALAAGWVVSCLALLLCRSGPRRDAGWAMAPLAVFAATFLGSAVLVRPAEDRILMPGIVFLWAMAAPAGALLLARLGRAGLVVGWLVLLAAAGAAVPHRARLFLERQRYSPYGAHSTRRLAERAVDLALGASSCVVLTESIRVDYRMLDVTRSIHPALGRTSAVHEAGPGRYVEGKFRRWLDRHAVARVVLVVSLDGFEVARQFDLRRHLEGRGDYALAREVILEPGRLAALVFERR